MPSPTLAAAAAFLLDDSLPAAAESLGALMTDANKPLPASSLAAATAPKSGVPALRFPEFAEAAPWEVKRLGDNDVANFPSQKIPVNQAKLETFVSTENLLPNYFGVKQANKVPESGALNYFQKGDILVSNIRPYLKKIWLAHFDGTSSNDVIIIKAKSIDRHFLKHSLQSASFIDYVMKSAKGVKMPRGDIKSIKAYPIPLPTLPEQEKIAACLSALDAKISSAEAQLTQLHAHKQGLLQQLFPAQGQSAPKLRFPEFVGCGAWEVKMLGDNAVAFFASQKTPVSEAELDTFVSTENLLPNYFGVKQANKLPESGALNHFKTGDILVSNIRPYLKKIWLAQFDGTASNDVVIIRATNIDSYFLQHSLQSDAFIDYVMKSAKGVKMPRGDIKSIKAYPIPLPTLPEQQKIAACLSALDAKVLAQAEQVRLLQAHKQGLMQQLFPSVA
jgi:type I restriction enzyme S subunit